MAVLEQQRGITTRRVGATVVALGFVVFWIYIFGIATPDAGDRLADQTFPEAAEPVCKAALDDLAAQGLVDKRANTPAERADLTDQADRRLTTMVADLRAIAPTEGEAAAPINQWLGDWDIWLSDRQTWSDTLRTTNTKASFLETGRQKGGRTKGEPNSRELDRFANEVNNMPSCATPEDV